MMLPLLFYKICKSNYLWPGCRVICFYGVSPQGFDYKHKYFVAEPKIILWKSAVFNEEHIKPFISFTGY